MKLYFTFILIFLLTASGLSQNNTTLFDADDSEDTRIEKNMAYTAENFPTIDPVLIINSAFGVTHPLFVGVDDVTVPAYNGNPSTNEWLQAFIGFQVWGAAYDNINDKIYINNGTILYEWPVGGTVTQLGTITDPGGTALSFVGLAWHNNVLYGIRNIANEAVYTINTSTFVATVFIDYVDADFDLGGVAVDPNTGLIYATNDDATPFGPGLFRINLDGTGTLIASYPTGQTDIDGLAISEAGIAYLVTDEPGFIYVYDIIGGVYLAPLNAPWTSSEVFSGGTWNRGIIPVELVSFTGVVHGNDVTLSWESASEINNSGFTVLRKSSASGYESIGFVAGYGTTTERKLYSFTDYNVSSGSYIYRLKQIDFDGTFEYSNAIEIEINLPSTFSLYQNYPNPFNPATRISFSLEQDSKVSLKVFNVLGQEVALLIDQDMAAGVHGVDFNAGVMNSGVYFYKLSAVAINGEEFSVAKKMILTK